MALTLVGVGSAFPTTNSTVNVTLPVGTAAGDLCVVAAIADKTFTATPSGFTLLTLGNANAQTEIRTSYKVLVAGDITNGFVTMPGDPNFNGIRYALWFLSGHNGVDVNAVGEGTDGTGTNSVNTIPSPGTTTAANDMVLVATGGRVGGTSWASLPPGNTTDQNNPGGYISMYAAHYTQAAAGAGSSQTATNNGAAFQRWASTAIAVLEGVATVAIDFRLIPPQMFAPGGRPMAWGGATGAVVVTVTGVAASDLGGLTATASGTPTTFGTAAASFGELTATISATVTPVELGTGAANLGGLTATAAAVRKVNGAVAQSLGALTATATAARTVNGVIAQPLGGLTATAVATRSTSGAAVGAFGALTATVAGTRKTAGTAAANLGGLTATGTDGLAGVIGAASAAFGGLTAAASGVPTTFGAAAANLGGLTASATGTRKTAATAASSLGGLNATATATRTIVASSAANFGGITGTVIGLRKVVGIGSSVFGGLTAAIVVGSPVDFDRPPGITGGRQQRIVQGGATRAVIAGGRRNRIIVGRDQ